MEIIPFVIAGGKLSEVSEQVNDELNYKANLSNQEKVLEVSENIITDLITEQKNFKGVLTREITDFYYNTISKLVRKHFYADVPDLPLDFKPIHDFSSSEKNELDALIQKLKFSFKEKFKSLT